MKWHTIDS